MSRRVVRLDLRYSLLTVMYLAAIYWLSSLPDLSAREPHPLVRLAQNLGHAPLFAGLAFCVLKSLSGARAASSEHYTLAFVISAACAALDEWHQSFVSGRFRSIGDLLLDLVGIGGMFLFLRLLAARTQRRQARHTAPMAPLVSGSGWRH